MQKLSSNTLLEGEDTKYKIDMEELDKRRVYDTLARIIDKGWIDRRKNGQKPIPLLKEQSLVLREYLMEKKESVKFRTLEHNIKAVSQLGLHIKKPYGMMNKHDLIEYINYLERDKNYSHNSLNLRKMDIILFFKWLYRDQLDDGEKPEPVKWIKNVRMKRKIISTQELVTEEELEKLLLACNNPRDKCIIMILHEVGCRATELVNIKIGDITLKSKYAEIMIRKSKTKERPVYLVKSKPYITQWLEVHPYKNERIAYLFISVSNNAFGKGLRNTAINSIVQKAVGRAGLKKHVWSHLFRHTSVQNDDSAGFTPTDLQAKFGWSDLQMLNHYTRPNSKQMKRKELEKYGISPEDEENTKKKDLVPKICPNCNTENPATQSFCKCGQALSYVTITEERERESEASSKLNFLLNNDSDFKEKFEKLIEEAMRKEISKMLGR